MPTSKSFKISLKRDNLFLRVSKGHFATNHSHTNYYIDVTTHKARLSEARAIAEELCPFYNVSTIVDTILCLEGTEVIGTCLANALTSAGFINMNAHQTIYVVTPERTSGGQLLLRENLIPMVKGKHVLILSALITSGSTADSAIDAVNYYGGIVTGVSAIFANKTECNGYPVQAVFNSNHLPDYASYLACECPMCKEGIKIDALVNAFGYSKL
ncbi:MAG: orotate phosphoribosyltransferase [Monoglobales bacterium]